MHEDKRKPMNSLNPLEIGALSPAEAAAAKKRNEGIRSLLRGRRSLDRWGSASKGDNGSGSATSAGDEEKEEVAEAATKGEDEGGPGDDSSSDDGSDSSSGNTFLAFTDVEMAKPGTGYVRTVHCCTEGLCALLADYFVHDHSRNGTTQNDTAPPRFASAESDNVIRVAANAVPWSREPYLHKSPQLRLHDEILDFCDLVSASAEEMELRHGLERELRSLIEELWPHSGVKVEVFGSTATGLCLPTSDVDISVLGVGGGEKPPGESRH